jgi:NADH dehydrogenase
MRRTYYLFQMPRWDTRLRIALDWTIALFFKPDITKVDLAEENEQERRNSAAGARSPAGVGVAAADAGRVSASSTASVGGR